MKIKMLPGVLLKTNNPSTQETEAHVAKPCLQENKGMKDGKKGREQERKGTRKQGRKGGKKEGH